LLIVDCLLLIWGWGIAVADDPGGGGGEIIDEDGALEKVWSVLFDLGAVTGADEEGSLEAGVPAAFEVDEFIADEIACGEVELELVAGVEEELRGWFAAVAGLVGGFGCDVNAVKRYEMRGEQRGEAIVDAMDVGEGEEATADAGLVGHDEEAESGVEQALERGEDAGEQGDEVWVAEVMAFLDDGSVAVEEHGAVGHGLRGGHGSGQAG
jgi:hypothetical protein